MPAPRQSIRAGPASEAWTRADIAGEAIDESIRFDQTDHLPIAFAFAAKALRLSPNDKEAAHLARLRLPVCIASWRSGNRQSERCRLRGEGKRWRRARLERLEDPERSPTSRPPTPGPVRM